MSPSSRSPGLVHLGNLPPAHQLRVQLALLLPLDLVGARAHIPRHPRHLSLAGETGGMTSLWDQVEYWLAAALAD